MEKFQVIQPSPLLAPYIKQYWFLTVDDVVQDSQRFIPTGCMMLTFHQGKQVYSTLDKGLLPKSCLSGQISSYTNLLYSQTLSFITVVFQPAGAKAFFQIPAKPFSFEDRDKNIRDVLVHLYEWHQLLLNWANSNQSGNKINFLPEPYNWKTYPQMNIGFWEKHQNTSLEEAISLLGKSHSETMKLIDTFSNEELFKNKYFSWTGTTSLGSYCVSATSSHYDWAIKKIKKHQKDLK